MAQEALYRRYRPRRFRDVVGQTEEVRVLREAVRQDHVRHAYLLAGPRGTGKTSVARIFAQAVTCAAPEDGEPCGRCPSCEAAERQSHLDIVEIDGASHRGIDDVRDLRELVWHAPAMGRRKVYIVDEVHMLTEPAFNAFLKTLEEPPPHVVFIFATTEPQKIPVTVLSRCQRFDFHRLPPPLIAARLKAVAAEEGLVADDAALLRIAEASDGALRDALSLLDQVVAGGPATVERVDHVLGALSRDDVAGLVATMGEGDLAGVLARIDALYDQGRDPHQILRDTARALRDAWAAELLGGAPPTRPPHAWLEALDELAQAEGRLRGTFPARLVVELAMLKAASALAVLEPSLRPEAPPPAVRPPAPTVAEPEPVSVAPPTVQATAFEPAWTPGPVLERLRRTRPITAAVFSDMQLVADNEGGATVVLPDVLLATALHDVASGHREAFEAAWQAVYGSVPLRYRAAEEAPGADEPPWDRIRSVFGPDTPVHVASGSARAE